MYRRQLLQKLLLDYYQEKSGDKVDNWLTAASAQVTIGGKYTQNTMDTPFNNNYNQKKVER